MKFLFRIISSVFKASLRVDDAEILRAFDPWTLACSVGSCNGSIGAKMSFGSWVRLSRKNWMPAMLHKFPSVSQTRIVNIISSYVAVNHKRDYRDVLKEETILRGETPALVLAPGETARVVITEGSNK